MKISKATLRALEADFAERPFREFVWWWREHGGVLPSVPTEHLRKLWDFATDQVRALGIDDDARGQVSLYAAARELMKEFDATGFLRVSDILFEPGSRDERLAMIVASASGIPGS